MADPTRLQLSRGAGFSLQQTSELLNGRGARSIARPGPFGNPFHFDAEGAVAFREHQSRTGRATPCQIPAFLLKFGAWGGKSPRRVAMERWAQDHARPGEALQHAVLVEAFAWWLTTSRSSRGYRASARRRLAGFNLACWCAPDLPCHADPLLAFVNGGDIDAACPWRGRHA